MQHSVTTLEQCCNYSKQCRNNVATLCCAKNRRCESSRVASPLHQEPMTLVYTKCSIGNMMQISRYLQGALTIIIFFLVIFADMALKLEKLAQLFQVSIHVLPCHPCNRLCSDYLSRLRIEIDTNKNYFLSTRHSSSNSKRVKIKLNIQLQVMLPGETPGETSAK